MKRNAIILAAGTASRFVPLSSEYPKGLLVVKGEVLIERQIHQLIESGIDDITLVAGYKAEMFEYLVKKYNVSLVLNEDYARYNNTSSIIRVIDKLDNTFVCSSDNYFPKNVFEKESADSYYSALYAEGSTDEYCLSVDSDDKIVGVTVGGNDSWFMIGHVYFNHEFSKMFKEIMIKEYKKEETKQGYWEDVYIKYIDQLPKMTVNRYKEGEIQEFDSIDELRVFDESYISDTRSSVLKDICSRMEWKECELHDFTRVKHEGRHLLFTFNRLDDKYCYDGSKNSVVKI